MAVDLLARSRRPVLCDPFPDPDGAGDVWLRLGLLASVGAALGLVCGLAVAGWLA